MNLQHRAEILRQCELQFAGIDATDRGALVRLYRLIYKFFYPDDDRKIASFPYCIINDYNSYEVYVVCANYIRTKNEINQES